MILYNPLPKNHDTQIRANNSLCKSSLVQGCDVFLSLLSNFKISTLAKGRKTKNAPSYSLESLLQMTFLTLFRDLNSKKGEPFIKENIKNSLQLSDVYFSLS